MSIYACRDGLSFNQIINSYATKDHLTSLGYVLPKSIASIKKYIFSYYDDCCTQTKRKLQEIISDNNKVALTLDEWTSIKFRRYLNINVHFKEKCYNLGIFRIVGRADSDNIYRTTERALGQFDLVLTKDVFSITTDGASVMSAAFRNLEIVHQLCFNHAIHLAIVDVLYRRSPPPSPTYIDINVACEDENSTDDSSIKSNGIFDSSDMEPDTAFFNNDYEDIIAKIRAICKKFKSQMLNHKFYLKKQFCIITKSYHSLLISRYVKIAFTICVNVTTK